MLIVNNSMPKSGSSLLRYYIVEMIRNFQFNGQALLVEMINNGELEGRGSFVRKIHEESIEQLVNMSQEHGPILIKVHLAYSNEIEHMLDHKEIFMTYTYRDPRDMILSAMDHHKRVDTEFVRYTTIEESIPFAAHWAQQAILWKNSKITYDISYNQLMNAKKQILNHINMKAGFNLPQETIDSIIASEVLERKPGKNQFNKGLETRYKNEMSQSELEMCNETLKDYIDLLM